MRDKLSVKYVFNILVNFFYRYNSNLQLVFCKFFSAAAFSFNFIYEMLSIKCYESTVLVYLRVVVAKASYPLNVLRIYSRHRFFNLFATSTRNSNKTFNKIAIADVLFYYLFFVI